MKKTYIKPTIDVVNIETEGFFAVSPLTFEEDGNNGSGTFIDDYAGGDAMSKSHSFDVWGFDDEEE